MWSKNFRNFGWCESGGKTLDFASKMQKIKPKTIRFRLYLVWVTGLEPAASTTPTDVGLSSRALCVLSCRFRSKTLALGAFFVHCFRVFRVCLWSKLWSEALFKTFSQGFTGYCRSAWFFFFSKKSVNGHPCGQPHFIVYAASLFQFCLWHKLWSKS